MKALFIGGTGNISTAVSRLAVARGVELTLLNRGQRKVEIEGADSLVVDINDEAATAKALKGRTFDVVVNWIAFAEADVERDIRLFADKAGQYIFISSASAYQKPLAHPVVTEDTPLCNPYWDYSRAKIACEERLLREVREQGFPATIVRPSLTYDTVIPVAIGGWDDYGFIARMKAGKPVIVHGDGTSLWTVTHSEDFAKGFVGLMGHQQVIGHAFHITSDEILTWDQIYQAVAAAAGVEAHLVHVPSDFIVKVAKTCGWGWMEGNLLGDKAVSAIMDNSKIKRFVPGFQATIPFQQGIRRTIEWFEDDPARMTINDGNNQFIDRVLKAYDQGFQAIG
jgi:nucleoside-diphosphate-sugar epimerase